MNPRHIVRPWQATHKVQISFEDPTTSQGLMVMLVEDGNAYTRFEWVQGLAPSFQRTTNAEWRFIGWNDMDAATPNATLNVQAIDPRTKFAHAA